MNGLLILLAVVYVIGIILYACVGGAIFFMAQDDFRDDDRKLGAHMFMHCFLWPLMAAGFIRDLMRDMRKTLGR